MDVVGGTGITRWATAAVVLLLGLGIAAPGAAEEPSPQPTAEASPAPSPDAPSTRPFVAGVTPQQDKAQVAVTAPARTVPTEYWVEHGTTTEYGQQTTRQRLEPGDQQRLTFSLTGLTRGDHHVRAVAAADGVATVEPGNDVAFFASGVSFLLTSTRPTGDGAYVLTAITTRDVATDYWLEYGPTTGFGQQTARQTVPAAGSQKELLFQISGLAPGTYYARPVAQTAGAAAPDRGEAVTFTTSSTTGPRWPTCESAESTQCVRSFTVDGAAVTGVRPEVFLAGGGLNIHAISPRGDQELLYAGSPVSATSTVAIVVDAGTYDPDVLLPNAHVSTARVDRSGGHNVITFAGRPERTSFTTTGCRIGSCGDDTTRADDEYAGRWQVGAFPLLNNDAAYVAAARHGLWLSTNAQSRSTPGYNPQTRTLSVLLAAPHLTARGALNTGTFQAFLPSQMFTDVWKLAGPEDLQATVTAEDGAQPVTSSWAAATGGWILTLSGLHYSSPVVAIAPRTGAQTGPSPAPRPSPGTTPQETHPRVSLDRSVISAAERVVVTYQGAPGTTLSIWSKTQPATGYSRIAAVALDANGIGTSSHAPRKNTRIMATTVGGLASGQPLIQVRSVASLNAQRVGLRAYTFSGTVSPALPNRLVSLYRNGVLVAQGRTSASGVYVITKTLAGGTFGFLVRTPNDTSNLGATSRTLRMAVV